MTGSRRSVDRGPYIGLMSGTSLDGVDGLLVEFSESPVPAAPVGSGLDLPETRTPVAPLQLRALGFASRPLVGTLREQLFALQAPGSDELSRAALAAIALTDLYAEVVAELVAAAGLQPQDIQALGAHGQTIRHRPELGYTLQLLAPARLAEQTGIDVVADLRSADVAAGGQGAPLVPAFHAALFDAPGRARAIVNLGGIGNVTRLDGLGGVRGHDTGPGNLLLDAWCHRHTGAVFDEDGRWGMPGAVIPELLARCLAEPWFSLPAPRSTGRDLFGLRWLEDRLTGQENPVDVQATLAALTAETVHRACIGSDSIYVCGGGARNSALMRAIRALCAPTPVSTTDALGLPAHAVEAAAFAWLARERFTRRPAGRPTVTGARGARILGAVWPAPPL